MQPFDPGAQLRIELERAVDDDKRQRRAEAVAVDNHLISVSLVDQADQCVRQTVQTLTQLWPDTMDKITREIPVVQRIADMDEAAEGPAQSRENPEPEQRSPNQMIGQPGTAYGKS